MKDFRVTELTGSHAADVVLPLYIQEGNGIQIRDSDLFFVGFIGDEVVGSVRFCIEQATPMLRTMRIAKRFQGQGYGHLLLKHFENYLVKNEIKSTYCIPFSHLERFYGSIGFKSIDENLAPVFIQERLREYRTKSPLVKFLCMSRTV